MVLVANKVDLVHLRKVTTDQGQEMAAKHNVSTAVVNLFLVLFLIVGLLKSPEFNILIAKKMSNRVFTCQERGL